MELASFILAVVAFIIAIPPLAALFCSQPAILAHFSQTQWGIACIISNAPVNSRLLRLMGVVRREPEVRIEFYIEDSAGHILVAP